MTARRALAQQQKNSHATDNDGRVHESRGRSKAGRNGSGRRGRPSKQATTRTLDFLGSIKDAGATAVMWHGDRVIAACSFIEHISAKFAEVTLMAVSRGRSRRGVGSALLRAVEASMQQRGIMSVAVCAGLDCVGFWHRHGYQQEATMEPRCWALLSDPFGNSRVMSKALVSC